MCEAKKFFCNRHVVEAAVYVDTGNGINRKSLANGPNRRKENERAAEREGFRLSEGFFVLGACRPNFKELLPGQHRHVRC